MEKLPMCRICLVENVRMYIVVSKNLQELYEKLTDVPFVTEDSRPMVACFICCTKLKQCYQWLSKCLQAKENSSSAQMMNEDFEPVINRAQLELCNGLTTTPIETISIVDVGQPESIVIKEEIPAGERLDDVTAPKEEHLSDGATVAKKPKLEDTITAKHKETEQAHSTIIRNSQNHTSKPDTKLKEPFTDTKRGVNNGINNTAIDTNDINSNKKLGILEKPYKCDICQRGFSRSSQLKIHIRVHTGEKPYKCDICQRGFSMMNTLTRHIRIHTGEKPYKCDICQRSFSIKSRLTCHIRIHTGEKPYKCDICQSSFNQSCALKQHNRIHNSERPYKCDVCQRGFSNPSRLKIHIRVHTGEKPYKCDICQRSFIIKNTLTRHILVHTGEKLYECDICQRSFSQSINLKTHIRIHTGEKPYKCDICQRSFSRSSYLKKHIRIHTDKKPSKCDVQRVSQHDGHVEG